MHEQIGCAQEQIVAFATRGAFDSCDSSSFSELSDDYNMS